MPPKLKVPREMWTRSEQRAGRRWRSGKPCKLLGFTFKDIYMADILENPIGTQAERILSRFGGDLMLLQAAKDSKIPISRRDVDLWLNNSTGYKGVIPPQYWPAIFKLARLNGINLKKADFDPRPVLPNQP